MKWHFSEAEWRLLPGAIASILIAALLNLGLLDPLEQAGYLALFELRGQREWDDRLVLIAIDDSSIEQLGRFPLARKRYAELLDRLTQADASVVAIDLIFSESSPDDAALVQAMLRSKRVVLAQAEDQRHIPLLPISKLQDAAVATGHIQISADRDGITRAIEPEVNGNLAFGIAAAMSYSMMEEAVSMPNLSDRFWLNWLGRTEQIPQYSFSSVLRGEVPDSAFRDKLVLVGVTAAGTDIAPTPFDRNPPANGVHLQATLIDNVLRRNALRPISHPVITALIFAVGGIGFSVILSYCRTGTQVLLAILVSIGWLGGSVAALKINYLPPVALPIGLIISSTISTALTERSRMNLALKRQVNQLQQRYKSALVHHVEKNTTSIREIAHLTGLADQLGQAQLSQVTIAHSLPIGLIAADLTGQVWFCNTIATSILKVGIGSELEPILVPAWLSLEEWQQMLKQPDSISIEKAYHQKWFCLRIEPLAIVEDSFLISLEDITVHKAIELNLGDQITELNQLSDLKDEFLSTATHELRTPLTNMKMAIQLFKIAKTEAQKERYLKVLENECNREADLVNGLLDLQRIESGRQPLAAEPIDLATWLPNLLESFYRRTESRQQHFKVMIDSNLPILYGDHTALERILAELINNACKYTPPNEQIVVTAESTAPWIEFRVENSGVEIPIEAQSKIFDRFYRIPNGDPWKQGGTGLGLALVKGLVELLQGTIELTSKPNWTIFTVRFASDKKSPDPSESSDLNSISN